MNSAEKKNRIRAGTSESSYGGVRMACHDGPMRNWLLGIAAIVILASCGAQTLASDPLSNPDTNQVSYWCDAGGTKYEPVSTPFVVPAPPAGTTWVLLVLKAGSGEGENQTFANPVVGQSYSRTDGKGISHAILCYEPNATTTSTTSTTSTSTTSTSTTSTTSTTLPTPDLFAIEVAPLCPDGTTPEIEITFGNRPDLDGQTGTLTFSTGGSASLVFDANNSTTIPYPASAGTGPVTMTYTLGEESVTRSTTFPEACTQTTTSTTVPGQTTTSTTTTTVPGQTTTTTTAPPTTVAQEFRFGAAASVCVAEVPTIRITFLNTFPELAGRTGTLTITALNGGAVVSTQPLVYRPGTTVDILYPGTVVNADGTIADVPGWNLNQFGLWVRDPSDAFLRDGLALSYTVNPTATALVTYPPESAACANPENPPPGLTPTVTTTPPRPGSPLPETL